MKLFPIEISRNTYENNFTRRNITSRLIYTCIIAMLLCLIASMPFIKVKLSSQSRGIVRAIYDNNTVQSVVSAEIYKSNLNENLFVHKGDTLVWLRTDIIDEQINRLLAKQKENKQFISDINNILSRNILLIRSPKYKSEYSHHLSKLNEQNITIEQVENEYNISKVMYEKGGVSRLEYERSKSKWQVAKSQLSTQKEDFKNRLEIEKTTLEIENKDLLSKLKGLEKDKTQYVILAPISGNIIQYSGVKQGNFIIAGKDIAQISSAKDLSIECYVLPTDIGYIHLGQEINVHIDAFDYRQWGLLHGKVTEIISDVITIENKPFFKVKCSIDKQYLELKNGYQGSLKKGMSLTCRFTIAERNLAQLLFDRVDDWMNPKIIQNEHKD